MMGTLTGNVITLANSIVGVSVLAMPFCFKQCGILLSILMLLFSNAITRLACYYLMKSAIIEKRKNFEMLAFRAFGPTGKLIVELCIIGFMLGTCVAYFVIMGDLGPAIIGPILGFEHPSALRPSVLIGIAVFVVLPLGLLKNVDSLSAVCAATIAFYFCFFLKVVGEALNQFIGLDWMDKVYFWRPSGILQCIPIFSMALFCQTQLFEIFDSLPSNPLDRMTGVVKSALNMVTLFYISVGFFGYVAYCDQSFSGNLMMNFSPTITSDVIKIGFILSIAVSFPLVIFPCRASIYSLCFSKGYEHAVTGSAHIPETRFKCITLLIVTSSLVAGLLIPNIEVVLGLVGSTMGVIICVIIPGVIFLSLTVKNNSERLVAKFLVCIGMVIMVVGTYANLYATEEAVSGSKGMNPSRNPELQKILPKVGVESGLLKALPDIKPQLKDDNILKKPIKEVYPSQINYPKVLENLKSSLKKDTKKEPPVPEEPPEPKLPKVDPVLPIAPVENKLDEIKSEPSVMSFVKDVKVDDVKKEDILKNEKSQKEDMNKLPVINDVPLKEPAPIVPKASQSPLKYPEKDTVKQEQPKENIVKNDQIVNIDSEKKKDIQMMAPAHNGSSKPIPVNQLKENLIEKIKEHEEAQKKLNEEGVKLLKEIKDAVKNVNNSIKLVNVKTGAVTDIKSNSLAKVDLVQNAVPNNQPSEKQTLTQQIVQGIPLPLAVKELKDKDAIRNRENEVVGKPEIGRDILEAEKEVREKRDIEVVLKAKASSLEINDNIESVSQNLPTTVLKVSQNKSEGRLDADKIVHNDTASGGTLAKLKNELDNCIKNKSSQVSQKVDEIMNSESKMDELIKAPSYLSNPNSVLNESPKLVGETNKDSIPEMPKKRDLKSLSSEDVIEERPRNV